MELASHDQQGFFSSASSRNSVLTSTTLLSLIFATLPAFIYYFWALKLKSLALFDPKKTNKQNNSKIPSVIIKKTTTNTKTKFSSQPTHFFDVFSSLFLKKKGHSVLKLEKSKDFEKFSSVLALKGPKSSIRRAGTRGPWVKRTLGQKDTGKKDS